MSLKKFESFLVTGTKLPRALRLTAFVAFEEPALELVLLLEELDEFEDVVVLLEPLVVGVGVGVVVVVVGAVEVVAVGVIGVGSDVTVVGVPLVALPLEEDDVDESMVPAGCGAFGLFD